MPEGAEAEATLQEPNQGTEGIVPTAGPTFLPFVTGPPAARRAAPDRSAPSSCMQEVIDAGAYSDDVGT